MAGKKSVDITPIITLAILGVGGYFIWKKFFKEEEEELTGFQDLSIEFPTNVVVGETVNGTIVGKNYEDESYLCFIKLVDQETGELLAPKQSAEVGAGLSKQFLFEFIMPDKPSIRFNIHFGRIIDGEEKIDKTAIRTISSEEGYPKEICRDPYCFMVNNSTEEIQMNEFLGIDPPGMDLDSYLEGATQAQLDYWKDGDGGVTFDGWFNIWTNLHRQDIVEFVISKYNQYAKVVSATIDSFTITTT